MFNKLREPASWIEFAMTALLSLVGFAAIWGRLGARVDALEIQSTDYKGFKEGTIKDVAVMHTELHMLMDHFGVRHKRAVE